MTWRKRYKVHPIADLFPMMSDEELAALGEDIKKNGQHIQIAFLDGQLIGGRNRLEAMERVGIPLRNVRAIRYTSEHSGPNLACTVAQFVIGENIRRRHLTKEQQADIIVQAETLAAALSRQNGETIERKRGGQVDEIKAAAVATGKQYGISERTIERSLAKVSGRPKKKRKTYPVPDYVAAMPDDHAEQVRMPCGTPIDGMTMTGAQMKEAFRTGQLKEVRTTLKQCEAAVYGMREWALLMLAHWEHLPDGVPAGVPAEQIERWRKWIAETRNALDIAEGHLKTSPDVSRTAPKTTH